MADHAAEVAILLPALIGSGGFPTWPPGCGPTETAGADRYGGVAQADIAKLTILLVAVLKVGGDGRRGAAPVVAECCCQSSGGSRQIGLVLERRGFRGNGLIDKLGPVGPGRGRKCVGPLRLLQAPVH